MTRTKVYKNGQWSYADNVGTAQWGSIEGTLSNQTDLNTALGNKVDKETGKGLFSGSYNDLTNKPTIPTKTSDLTNDSGFIDNTYHDNTKEDIPLTATTLPATAVVNTIYDLGEQTTINLVLPSGNLTDWVEVGFISGSTATSVTISSTSGLSEWTASIEANSIYTIFAEWGRLDSSNYGWLLSYKKYTKANV